MSKQLTDFHREVLASGNYLTFTLQRRAELVERMLECDDITLAQQKELRIARKALWTCHNLLAKNTHL